MRAARHRGATAGPRVPLSRVELTGTGPPPGPVREVARPAAGRAGAGAGRCRSAVWTRPSARDRNRCRFSFPEAAGEATELSVFPLIPSPPGLELSRASPTGRRPPPAGR